MFYYYYFRKSTRTQIIAWGDLKNQPLSFYGVEWISLLYLSL